MDRQGHDQLQSVEETCADGAEVLALSITRFIAAGYMTSDVACWDAAYNSAEALLGPSAGPQFVASMAGLMRAIRAERHADWRFMPAPCCRVTDDESRLFKLLTLGRQHRWNDVRHQAALLAGTKDAPRITSAVQVAAGAINRTELSSAELNAPCGQKRQRCPAVHKSETTIAHRWRRLLAADCAAFPMRTMFLIPVMLISLGASGCTVTEQRAGGGAVIGAGTGALIGALATGRPGGALAGAAIGGATGAIVGAATTPAPVYGRPVRPVYVEHVRERPVYVEEEIELAPVCRTRVDRFSDGFGNVEVRRSRLCR